MELKQLLQERYATKKFTGESIPEEKFNQLKELITLAPSSFGLQPFRIKVVTDQETKDKLKAAAWNQEQLSSASHVLIFCADNKVLERIEEFKQLLLSNGAQEDQIKDYIGMMVQTMEGRSAEDLTTWSQKQCYIALENALLGAKELGYDSCPMEGFDPAAFSEILGLPENLTPSVICPVGIAADKPQPKVRFDDLFI